jgi:hypothetical protein
MASPVRWRCFIPKEKPTGRHVLLLVYAASTTIRLLNVQASVSTLFCLGGRDPKAPEFPLLILQQVAWRVVRVRTDLSCYCVSSTVLK